MVYVENEWNNHSCVLRDAKDHLVTFTWTVGLFVSPQRENKGSLTCAFAFIIDLAQTVSWSYKPPPLE